MGVHRGGRGRQTTASLVAFIVEHVVVVHVHQDGDGLADDQGYPDGRVPVVTPEEFGDEPGQRDLEGMERVRGSSISPTAKRGSTSGACRTTPPPPPNSCPPSQGTQHGVRALAYLRRHPHERPGPQHLQGDAQQVLWGHSISSGPGLGAIGAPGRDLGGLGRGAAARQRPPSAGREH